MIGSILAAIAGSLINNMLAPDAKAQKQNPQDLNSIDEVKQTKSPDPLSDDIVAQYLSKIGQRGAPTNGAL